MASAKALSMDLGVLLALPEPDRTFWYHRGLLWNSCEAEAMEQDNLDRKLESSLFK